MGKHEDIIKCYQDGLSLKDVAIKFGYGSPNTIRNILLKYKIPTRTKAGFKPKFNEDYFENIDTEYKSYFLGYLMADGNVYERKNSQPCIRLEINQADKYILDSLKEELSINIEVKETRKNCCILRWHSKKMYDDLNRYGIVPNKTGKEIIPNTIPDNLLHHFIRGFFDGDGWVTNTTSHGKNKGSRKCIGFVSSKDCLARLREILHYELGTKLNKLTFRNSYYMLLYGAKNDVNLIINFMYKDSTIFLTRKRESCYQVYANTERAIISSLCNA